MRATNRNNPERALRSVIQWVTLAVATALIILASFWPSMLFDSSEPLNHGAVTLLIMGLCFALVTGSGILQSLERSYWILAVVLSWMAIIFVVELAAF